MMGFDKLLDRGFLVTVYGTALGEVPGQDDANNPLQKYKRGWGTAHQAAKWQFVEISGYKLDKRCVELAEPFLLMLPGDGKETDSDDCDWATNMKKWVAPIGVVTLGFSYLSGPIEKLIESWSGSLKGDVFRSEPIGVLVSIEKIHVGPIHVGWKVLLDGHEVDQIVAAGSAATLIPIPEVAAAVTAVILILKAMNEISGGKGVQVTILPPPVGVVVTPRL